MGLDIPMGVAEGLPDTVEVRPPGGEPRDIATLGLNRGWHDGGDGEYTNRRRAEP
jgi:hypothetical protein